MVLVSCVQNKAIEAIVEKLAESSLQFIVIGNTKRLKPKSCDCLLDRQVECHPDVAPIKNEIDRLEKKRVLIHRLKQRVPVLDDVPEEVPRVTGLPADLNMTLSQLRAKK